MEKGTSSRASSGSSYEVFLNFQGVDTRHGFTDFLYHGMVGAGILVFRDSESLHVGKEIGAELLQAIENSKIYIPIFSANYASSCWCLRELVYMVECTLKSNGNKEILPIFLDVESVDVKLKTNLYKQTLSKHQEAFCSEAESWQKALIAVGKIKGWNLKKDESQVDLIQSIIEAVLVKLNVRYKNVTEYLVGVDDRVEAIIKMLDVEFDDVKFLVIHGMGGVGKTTLTKVVFNRLSSRFQGCNFLSDVRESSERQGLVHLQKQLLSKFLDRYYVDQISEVDHGIHMIKRVLHNKKVLIVLDDVDKNKQLKYLAKKGNWFGSGSRIIITTRYKSVLMIDREATSEGPINCANVCTYEVQEMEFCHALELFSRHAFRRDSPPDDYVDLSEKVVSTLGKLPLALEVTGSSLSGRSKEFWVDTLKKLEKAPSMEVQKTLMITYERTHVLEWDSAYHSSIVPLYEVEELASGKTRQFWPELWSSSLREFEIEKFRVGKGKIERFRVGNRKIERFRVGNGKIKRFRVGNGKIKRFRVGNGKIERFTVGNGKIFTVGNGKIERFTVGNGKIERFREIGIVSIENGKIETFSDAYVQVLPKSTSSIAHEDSGRGKFVRMLLFHGKDVKPIELEKAKEAQSRRMSKAKKRGRSKSLGIFTEVVDS
ncbi:disease resistance protein RPV1-like [Eucalyptus grandis]|uniref:disease resistance protein RPV1-like n=1 Tax=Eucalyptus grandis TaxID=71139 RepID=UPI00192E7CD7|nr:disease resistance protein RPV1-like [Eucalyptus grandis]